MSLLSTGRSILVITDDVLGSRMAGPAIRAFEIAQALSAEHRVTLVSTRECTLASDGFRCAQVPPSSLRPLVAEADIVILQGYVLQLAPWIADTDKIIVSDIYDPMHLEQLEQARDGRRVDWDRHVSFASAVLNDQMARADFFICASEVQRNFWLGQLAALGRINPSNYERDNSLRLLIDVCPFGLSAAPPVRTRPAIRGVVPGIGAGDKVIIWAGGVYNWFDPLTLIAAVDLVRATHADLRLFFLGMTHPNPGVPAMRMASDARALSDELGLTGTHVFFNEGWVDYGDRQNYLVDADAGISTHFDHIETTFSFRTRILDYLWAGLPIVATRGDTFGDVIAAERLGAAVPERDAVALAAALEQLLYDDAFRVAARENVARVREAFVWDRALEPLLSFCRSASPSADRALVMRKGGTRPTAQAPAGVVSRNVSYAADRVREGGVLFAFKRGAAKAVRLVRSRLGGA